MFFLFFILSIPRKLLKKAGDKNGNLQSLQNYEQIKRQNICWSIEVIEECETKEEVNKRERFRIKVLNCKTPNGCNSINKIEKGENSISKIVAFAEALNTTPEYLMNWNDRASITHLAAV